MNDLAKSDDYRKWIVSIKSRVQSAQLKAAVSVNRELLQLYWFLGGQIVERQETATWGDGFLKQMSTDLLTEFPEMKGFSHRNLKSIRQWRQFWSATLAIGKQLVSQIAEEATQLICQIPWGHNILLIQKLKDPTEALFYVQKTIEHNWSRAVLTHQIESELHLREGKAVNNFQATLPVYNALPFRWTVGFVTRLGLCKCRVFVYWHRRDAIGLQTTCLNL